ncbi:hypothetical protein JCM8115_002184 [Rhodotorula mucilaginosa]
MSSTKAEQYKQAGNAAFAERDLDLALANFSTAIQLDPATAAYPLNRAAVYLKLREWTRAERDATTALELDGGVNLKAWFRRAVARRNLGRFELAKQDLEDAKRHGAGADVDAELALVLQQLGPATAEPGRNEKLNTKQFPTPPSQAPPSSAAPTSDRLRAALAKPASSSSSSSSNSPSLAPYSSTSTPAKRDDDWLNAVSTRRLTKTQEGEEPTPITKTTATTLPTKSAAASSFAAKKEARLAREKELMIAAARRENRDHDASSSSSVTRLTTTTTAPVTVTVSESSSTPPPPPVPSTSSSTTPISGTSPRAPTQATITTTTMSSSSSSSSSSTMIAICNSPTALEAHFLALNARQIPRGNPERYGPLRRLALDRERSRSAAGSGSGGGGTWREWMGQAGLTPDLLSEVVGEVVALFPPSSDDDDDDDRGDQQQQQHLEWVLSLLEGLTTCHRWDSASLFLSTEEREAVKRVLERARRRLDAVAGKWGVV